MLQFIPDETNLHGTC